MVAATLSVSTGARAQQGFTTVTLCSALTVLAPDPSSVPAANSQPPFKMPQIELVQGPTVVDWNDRIAVTFRSAGNPASDAVAAAVARCLETELILFLDHHPLLGVTPIERLRNKDGSVTLAFRITRPTPSGLGWTELLAKLWAKGEPLDVTVGVGVGAGAGGTELVVSEKTLKLALGKGSPVWAWAALVCAVCVLIAVWWFTNAMLDRRRGIRQSYSVSRLLLSCWVLTTICTVLIMMVRSGSMPSSTETGLAFLLAISGATTGLSGLIDLIRKPTNEDELPRLQRFWVDFFNDADGLALHRVQVVLFNLIILWVVWRDLIHFGTVARIDIGWATLLGASALTFVFGKSGESIKQMVPPAPAPAPLGSASRGAGS